MLFAVYCLDKPNSKDLRLSTRAAHLEHAKAHTDSIRLGGPLLTDDGEGMVGSLLILDMPDKAAVEAFVRDDPYFQAGLFEAVLIRPFKQILPAPT
ncbi:YciI family protein [Roseospira navarrensis]|uniref:YciI family protein n=1 Tax=Roseospira navarrensis TaxID=140058 RepID=A0A7X1ZCL7_9PROT|nr:YciI family protein [Roseospira navarrensis]MQX36089.1 YciI family protein [Roseospira navarrensis]